MDELIFVWLGVCQVAFHATTKRFRETIRTPSTVIHVNISSNRTPRRYYCSWFGWCDLCPSWFARWRDHQLYKICCHWRQMHGSVETRLWCQGDICKVQRNLKVLQSIHRRENKIYTLDRCPCLITILSKCMCLSFINNIIIQWNPRCSKSPLSIIGSLLWWIKTYLTTRDICYFKLFIMRRWNKLLVLTANPLNILTSFWEHHLSAQVVYEFYKHPFSLLVSFPL